MNPFEMQNDARTQSITAMHSKRTAHVPYWAQRLTQHPGEKTRAMDVMLRRMAVAEFAPDQDADIAVRISPAEGSDRYLNILLAESITDYFEEHTRSPTYTPKV